MFHQGLKGIVAAETSISYIDGDNGSLLYRGYDVGKISSRASFEEVAVQILLEVKPGRSLYTNVEFYAASIMKAIKRDSELFTPTFTASRIVGWTAHV